MQLSYDCTGFSQSRATRTRRKPRRRPEADRHLRSVLYSAAALVFKVSVSELEATTRRSPAVALARQTAMYLAHVCAGLSLRTVGQLFSRDRTTVAHGCAAVEDRRDDASFDRAVTWMEIALRASMAMPRPSSREDA